MFNLFHRRASFSQLGIQKDWHCHLLPGVDDGVQSIDESARILLLMRSTGIGTVVHTPHFNADMFPANSEASIKDKFARYVDALPPDITDSMELHLAGEYMVTDGFERRKMDELLQIEPGRVLIEMSYLYPSNTLKEAVFNISLEGITPVLAHPERYLYYSRHLGVFDMLHDMGVEFQLNLLSLGGFYGPMSLRILEYIMKKGWYSYVGSDTHSAAHYKKISALDFKADYLSFLK